MVVATASMLGTQTDVSRQMFISLIDNIALLLAVSLLHGLVISKAGHRKLLAQLLSGLAFGLAVLVAMIRPYELSPGIVFDGRSIVISLAGMFGGPVTAALTVVPATVYRLYSGGGGATMGVSVILSSGLLGMLFFHLRQRRPYLTHPLYLCIFGLLVHVNMLFWTLTLPHDRIVPTFKAIWLPVLTIYPLATLLLGTIMANLEAKVASEKALHESEAKYRTIAENLPSGVVGILDRDYRFLFIAGPELAKVGLAQDMVIGRTVQDLFPADVVAMVTPHFKEAFDDHPGTCEVFHQGRTYLTNVCPLHTRNGNVDQITVLAIDISGRKEAEKAIRTLNEELEQRVCQRTAQLETKSREIEAFSYSVSHDLRAPLRAISGFAQIIARRHRESLNEEGRHYFDNIIQASQHMDRLIEDLLRLSRLGRAGVHRENVSLRRLLEDIRARYSARIEDEQVTFTIPDDPPMIHSDATLVSVILTNLIENALTYRRAGVKHGVEVHCIKADATVTLGVTDNGIGIPAEYHEKIFALFQRLHTQDEYPGTGIGLALVKKATELLDGRVMVQSEVGKGSTFMVELPIQML
jgi:PAS domain S-box-containing protein